MPELIPLPKIIKTGYGQVLKKVLSLFLKIEQLAKLLPPQKM